MRDVAPTMMAEAVPWRTFRMRERQPHYSGDYWAATEMGHVIYESRLELSRLVIADFAPSVRRSSRGLLDEDVERSAARQPHLECVVVADAITLQDGRSGVDDLLAEFVHRCLDASTGHRTAHPAVRADHHGGAHRTRC